MTGHIGPTAQLRRVTGPGASSVKYDILTALLVTATRGDPVESRLALRLSLLITARFNWRTGSFAVGQKEIARMWGVTERTAKREMAELRRRGWIAVSVPAARGRVTQHAIQLPAVLRATMPHWSAVGPDFFARMSDAPEPEGEGAANVVPLHRDPLPLPTEDGTGWSRVAERLRAQDPATYNAWFAPLLPVDLESGILTLMAPNRFQADYVRTHFHTRLLAAVVTENHSIREVQITVSAP